MVGHRAHLLVSRIRLAAALFAGLTLLWVPIDVIAFPRTVWQELLTDRLLAAAALAAIATTMRNRHRLLDGYLGLAALLAVPMAFYAFSLPSFDAIEGGSFGNAVATGYALLPVVVVAGIGVFPLTLAESTVAGLSAVGLLATAGVAAPSMSSLGSGGGVVWVLFLLAGISSLAAMSQSAFFAGLVELMAIDPLTGCLNRRIGEQMLTALLSSAKRRGSALSVAFVDLDRFKAVNDRFGHRAGDEVLQAFAKRLLGGVRKSDLVVRWGGEEFVVVLPEADATAAMRLVERLASAGFGLRPDGGPQTASIGIADCRTDRVNEVAALVEIADARMYEAKVAGRARAVGPPASR